MQADFTRLKRRPFLIPLLMPLALFAVVIVAALWLLDARNSTVLILVRHAEVTQSDTASPQLNEAGKQRAATLHQWLAGARPARGVDAVYVSEDSPSQQTAAPLGQQMGLAINVVPTSQWAGLPRFIEANHPGQVALVVANKAALLALLKPLAGEFTLADDDYGSVFILFRTRLSKSAVIRLKY